MLLKSYLIIFKLKDSSSTTKRNPFINVLLWIINKTILWHVLLTKIFSKIAIQVRAIEPFIYLNLGWIFKTILITEMFDTVSWNINAWNCLFSVSPRCNKDYRQSDKRSSLFRVVFWSNKCSIWGPWVQVPFLNKYLNTLHVQKFISKSTWKVTT